MLRMRAEPVVLVELAWRWGRDSRHKLARITRELVPIPKQMTENR
jgi:hypothetical protein